MADLERLFRVLTTSKLEQKLEGKELPDAERLMIETELRRRSRDARIAGAPRRRPRFRTDPQRAPRWWQHRACPYIVVYAIPLLGVGTWSYLLWSGWKAHDHEGHIPRSALVTTLECFYVTVGFLAEGRFNGLDLWVLLLTLVAIPSYCVYRHPVTALVSFCATAFWIYAGNVFMALNLAH